MLSFLYSGHLRPFNSDCIEFRFRLGRGAILNHDGGGNGNVKKAIGLMSKTTSLHVHHASFYISLPSLYKFGSPFRNEMLLPEVVVIYTHSTVAVDSYQNC